MPICTPRSLKAAAIAIALLTSCKVNRSCINFRDLAIHAVAQDLGCREAEVMAMYHIFEVDRPMPGYVEFEFYQAGFDETLFDESGHDPFRLRVPFGVLVVLAADSGGLVELSKPEDWPSRARSHPMGSY